MSSVIDPENPAVRNIRQVITAIRSDHQSFQKGMQTQAGPRHLDQRWVHRGNAALRAGSSVKRQCSYMNIMFTYYTIVVYDKL